MKTTLHPKKDHSRVLNWKRRGFDPKDWRYRPQATAVAELPEEFDLPDDVPPPIFDQRDEGSCTAWGPKRFIVRQDMKDGKSQDYSAQFIYYNSRLIEGTTDYDAGAYIRDSVQSVNKYGAPPEASWPYLTGAGGNLTKRPTDAVYGEASNYKVLEYRAVAQTELDIKDAVYNGGKGNYVLIGFDVYYSFWDVGMDGIVPMPAPGESLEGGHGVAIQGWKIFNGKKYYKCVNQWSKEWGDKGYFYLPFEYVHSALLAGDFWTLTKVDGVDNPQPEPPPGPTPTPAPTPEPKGNKAIIAAAIALVIATVIAIYHLIRG